MDAIIDAAIHTDMAFDDEALAEYVEDLDSDSSPDDIRAAAIIDARDMLKR